MTALNISLACVADKLGAHVPITPSGQPVPPSQSFNAVSVSFKMRTEDHKTSLMQIAQTRFTYFVFGVLPLGFAKCSILFLYRRIFRGKAFSIITWAVIGLIIGWTISFFFVLLLQCIPVTLSTLHPPGLECIDAVPVTWALSVSAVVTDFIVMVIPWPCVWRLQMPIRQKFAVIGVFLLGAL